MEEAMSGPYSFTVADAAKYLGIHEKTVYALAHRGEIEHLRTRERKVTTRVVAGQSRPMRCGGRIRFSQAALDAWLDAHRVAVDHRSVPVISQVSALPLPARRRFS